MEPPYRLLTTPSWAARLLRGSALLAFGLLLVMLLPGLRPLAGRWLLGSFGMFWLLFGAFTLAFGWELPRRGGGICSSTTDRWLWLALGWGMILIGSCCLGGGLGLFPLRMAG